MKIDVSKMQKAKEEALQIIKAKENKEEAVVEAIEVMNSALNDELVQKIVEESNSKTEQESEKDFYERLGLRILSAKEKDFYEKLIENPKQAIDAGQIEIFPTSVIDLTLENIRTQSELLANVNMAPAGVKRWLVAEETGKYSWGGALSVEKLKSEIQAKFKSMVTEVNRLTVFMILPKAIKELALPFVDKYCRAILAEQLMNGLEHGVICGEGEKATEPIGLFKQIGATNGDGKNKNKDLNTDITSFSPKSLANAKKYLSNGGKRKISQILVICNPSDRALYIDPAMQDRRGNMIPAAKNLVVAESPECPEGKAGLALPKKYTLAMSDVKISDYDQTLADQDADLMVGGTFANGRAVDDNVCYVFDPTKLEEFIDKVEIVNNDNP